MNALHPKAPHWVRSGIFDALQRFEDFEARINAVTEEKDRGDVFEIFVEGYLATQTVAQCVRHWVVGDIPLSLREKYNLPADATGIDGIYDFKASPERGLGPDSAIAVRYDPAAKAWVWLTRPGGTPLN